MSAPSRMRVLPGLTLLFTLLMPLVAYALVPATPYISTLNLVKEFNGISRNYSGPAVYITVENARCTKAGTYDITLYRDQLIDQRIGTVTRDRNKTGGATWTNVGSAKYYFKFKKVFDSAAVRSDRVVMGSK